MDRPSSDHNTKRSEELVVITRVVRRQNVVKMEKSKLKGFFGVFSSGENEWIRGASGLE